MNLAHEIGDTIYVNEENTYGDEQLIIMVAKSEIDFAVCDETIAREMSKHYPEIDFSTDIAFTSRQPQYLAKRHQKKSGISKTENKIL